MTLSINSSAFSNNDEIPKKYTCDGQDISPPLEWSGIPVNCKSLALIVDDPDAPDPKAPKMTWVHWLLYNIPPEISKLEEGINISSVNSIVKEGINTGKRIGYDGPCPPIGRHRYFFKLYALDTMLPELGRATKTDIEGAMQGHIIEHAELIGTYKK